MPKDKYAQIGYLTVTETAAATLTFAGLSVFSNVLSNKGMVIHRAEYSLPRQDWSKLNASNEQVIFGLSGSEKITTTIMSNPEIYDYNDTIQVHMGTAGTGVYIDQPKVKDYTSLPGGGLLVPADRLFAYIAGVSTTDPLTVTCRFWFTIIELGPQDYLELAQAMRVLR